MIFDYCTLQKKLMLTLTHIQLLPMKNKDQRVKHGSYAARRGGNIAACSLIDYKVEICSLLHDFLASKSDKAASKSQQFEQI